jgi:hypothetical protein
MGKNISDVFGMLKRDGQEPVSIGAINEAIADGWCDGDRVAHIVRIRAQAEESLGDKERAARWLESPLAELSEATPLDVAQTEVGVRTVETILGKIRWGSAA